MGLTINTMSLGGMAIAIGSLVDDAIIDVENVFKRLRENFARPKDQRLPTLSIVFEASKEIRTSVVHATIITIVAFVPLFFLDGMEGRMLRPLGISFIVALFASMIVAVTLTPVLCSYLLTGDRVLRRNEKEPVVSRFLKRVYRRALEWVLAHKKAVLGSTVVLFAGALAVFLSLDRLNPILMTALSSALALIPLALGGSLPGNEIQSPMAKVILGGLLSSTLLNGFIIPSVYLIVNRKKLKA